MVQGDLKVAAKQGCKGRQPLDGARGALALSHFPAAFGGKKGLLNGPAYGVYDLVVSKRAANMCRRAIYRALGLGNISP
jgi:hypothetical protein